MKDMHSKQKKNRQELKKIKLNEKIITEKQFSIKIKKMKGWSIGGVVEENSDILLQ